ncbi:hypothetical protein C0992_004711 [Termitomyces sp. T32_za158]|nr:hypothetical protein C0992_004711 [Termitomyces sp. T32_za158]
MVSSTSSTSPTSFSTFSFGTAATSSSHYTSEEQPDLGAGFRTVLREWTYLQPPPRIPTYIHHYSASQNENSRSQTQDGRRSTVWAYGPIAQYLEDDGETETDTDVTRSVHIETETEIEPPASSTASLTPSVSVVDDYTLTLRTQPSPPASGSLELEFDLEHNHTNLGRQQETECGPSLGYLDQALSFIAAERAQLAARTSLSQPDGSRHVVGPPSTAIRPKRRRRKHKSSLSKVPIEHDKGAGSYRHAADPEESDEDAEGDDEQSPYYHSRLKYQSKSTPLTPRPRSPTSPTPQTSTLTPSFPLSLPINAEPCNAFSSSDSPVTSHTSGETKRPARKRTRAKSRKPSVPSSSSSVFPPPSQTHTLTHARSVPSLRFLARHREDTGDSGFGLGDPTVVVTDLEGIDGPTRNLVALARYLVKISPAEREVLEGVERKMVVQALRRMRAGASDTSPNSDVRTSGFREEREKKKDGKGREAEEEHGDGENILDPRGRAPKEGDPPVHVFIDQ